MKKILSLRRKIMFNQKVCESCKDVWFGHTKGLCSCKLHSCSVFPNGILESIDSVVFVEHYFIIFENENH